jgi:hypothetical protein
MSNLLALGNFYSGRILTVQSTMLKLIVCSDQDRCERDNKGKNTIHTKRGTRTIFISITVTDSETVGDSTKFPICRSGRTVRTQEG